MPTPSSVDANNGRPRASGSALGFLSRGIRSVSTFVSTIFSSSASSVPETHASQDEEESAAPRGSPASDEDNAHTGTPFSEDTFDNSSLATEFPTSEDDDSRSWASREEQPVGPDVLAARVGRVRELTPEAGPSNVTQSGFATAPSADHASQAAPSTSVSSSSRLRLAPPPEGASNGLPGSASTAGAGPSSSVQAPRRRGQLRREPVWIDGQDPAEVTPASELRGRDPRTMQENRYWRESWGPLPTLQQIHPGPGLPTARTIICWLHRQYGMGTERFWQAVDHIFPLPNGVEFRPRFDRIVRTSEWRNQAPEDWMDGVEPVDRVREPARADDAADSEAEVESVGYISDDGMAVDEDSEDAPAEAGPSSTALVLASSASSSSRTPRSPSGGSSALPASSPGAGPSTGPSRQRKRTRDSSSDAEHSSTSSPVEERPATRRRLDPGPSTASPSSASRPRTTARTSARATPRTPPSAPQPPAPAAPVVVPSRRTIQPRGPDIIVTPPSRRSSRERPQPTSSDHLTPPTGRGMTRRSSRRTSSASSSSRRSIRRPENAAQSSSAARATPSQPGPSTPGPSSDRVLRGRKRSSDEAQAEERGGDDNDERPPEDEERGRKRPKRR